MTTMTAENTETTVKTDELYADESLRELIDAGVFYGRKKAKTHPRMKPFILTNRNGIEIVNIEKTKSVLEEAMTFLAGRVATGGNVLFIGTQPPAEGVMDVAKEFNFPYVDRRWLGGTLTNLKVILTRIEYYKKLKHDSEKGLLDKYTKKERLMLEKELIKMKETMEGLETLSGLPSVVVVVDSNLHLTAVREARCMKIPVIAFVNTDSDPDLVDYAVVGNNKARTSINWFLGKIRETVRASKQAAPKAEPKAESAPEIKS
jgi:small subunit ribosomal protein S2